MRTTVQFLDAIKAQRNVSDYALAPLLGVTRAQVSRYRNTGDVISATVALRVAELLELDPAYVFSCAEAERAKRDERDADRARWQRIAERFAAVMLVSAGALPYLERPLLCVLCKKARCTCHRRPPAPALTRPLLGTHA